MPGRRSYPQQPPASVSPHEPAFNKMKMVRGVKPRQRLDYVHFNPVSSHWKLSKNDLDYYYPSARFYENGVDDFVFLSDLYEEFDGD